MAFEPYFRAGLGAVILAATAPLAHSQTYPVKTIRIMATGIGGSGDFAARLIAQELASPLGQQLIVDNRTIEVATETVVKAPPDGYTLLVNGSVVWLLQFLRNSVSWDAANDLAPVTLAVSSPNVLVVHPSLPVTKVKDLITISKAKPGALNYATVGSGTITHLAGELFKAMAAIDIVRINYKSAGAALTDLIGGQVQLMFATTASAAPHVKSGKLRAVAVTSARPSVLVRGLPTVAQSGLPGYEAVSTLGVWAPAKTPAPIINRINMEIARAIGKADVREKFFEAGAE